MGSTQRGHKHNNIYNQIHNYLKFLVDTDILPKEAIVGRLNVGNHTRTAVAVKLDYLHEFKEEILNALEDRYLVAEPEEIFQALENGSVIAAYLGLIEFSSEITQRLQMVVNAMPKSMQSTLIRNTANLDEVREKLAV